MTGVAEPHRAQSKTGAITLTTPLRRKEAAVAHQSAVVSVPGKGT